LPDIVGSNRTNPVALPPGRGKLATKPLPTGSAMFAKMMGMVRVYCSNAAVVGAFVRMTLLERNGGRVVLGAADFFAATRVGI
jgi:hypothetical protein